MLAALVYCMKDCIIYGKEYSYTNSIVKKSIVKRGLTVFPNCMYLYIHNLIYEI